MESPGESLKIILQNAREFLSLIIAKKDDLIIPEMRSAVQDAWDEIENKSIFTLAINSVNDVPEKNLKEAGLTDAQLEMKKKGYELAREKGEKHRALEWLKIILGSLQSTSDKLWWLEIIKEFIEAVGASLEHEVA
ncbi:MAG: hypothetical protein HZB29_04580 [Nitrospinae bacterium]|nr:hypothetical protein [Nitrospinota bacterium]